MIIKNTRAITDEMKPTINGNNLLTIIHCSINKTTNKAVAANSIPSVLNAKISASSAPIVHPKTQ